MTSTGNDIVALKAINIVRTKQLNFYSKIISVSEKDLYKQYGSHKIAFENFVWLLWSIKESAYKFLQRNILDLVFSPTTITINRLEFPKHSIPVKAENTGFDNEASYRAIVISDAYTLYSRSVINEEFIFSAVNNQDLFESTCWGIQQIDSSKPAHQSEAVRNLLTNRLKQLFPNADLHIVKSASGCPILMNGTKEMPVPVSLAHHDDYIAYSFQLDNQ
jgi:phosphopantetheinyl transferase (holo-ACP synthase)